MKKVVAISFISLLLFNLFGYRVLFNYEQQQSDIHLEASLDKDEYKEADLLTIVVPLSLPYQNNQVNFERVNGEITVKGKIYKYVKRKISDGNLVLLCLPNQDKMRLQSAKDEFFKYANDLVQNNQSKKSDHSKSVVLKMQLSDYDSHTSEFATAFYHSISLYGIDKRLNHLSSKPHNSPEQPPELA